MAGDYPHADRESELRCRYQDGDRDAFLERWNRHTAEFERRMLRQGCEAGSVEDLLQEAVVKLLLEKEMLVPKIILDYYIKTVTV